jgi:hypothetical protein
MALHISPGSVAHLADLGAAISDWVRAPIEPIDGVQAAPIATVGQRCSEEPFLSEILIDFR